MKDKNICVVYGGAPSEREVSLKTGQAIYNSLVTNGYQNVKLLDITGNNINILLEHRPDICVIAIHGKYGEDGLLQGFLEMAGIAYTGSGVGASAVAYDKYLSKLCFEAAGIPVAPYYLLSVSSILSQLMPCVVKPAREGSTVGISIVKTPEELPAAVEEAKKYDDKILVEKFIEGKELTVAVLNGKAMPPIWIKPNSGFYDYRSKYTKGTTRYLFDLEMSDEEKELIQQTAVKAYHTIGCEGVARIDFIYDGKTPYILEANTIPGMTETSLLPQACEKAGIPFIRLVEIMMEEALKRRKSSRNV